MNNRMAWGLAAILAVAVMGSGVALLASYQSRLPVTEKRCILLPPSDWGFRRFRYTLGPLGGPPILQEDWVRLGFFQVRLKVWHPAGPMGSTRNSTTR
jgi:hypothetical protein